MTPRFTCGTAAPLPSDVTAEITSGCLTDDEASDHVLARFRKAL